MNKLHLFALYPAIITSVLLSGCSNGPDDVPETEPPAPAPEENLLMGVWSAPAYGQLYQFGRTESGYTSTRFLVTQDSCLSGGTLNNLTAADLDAVTRVSENPDQIEIHRAGEELTPGVEHLRLDSIPELCTESLLPIKGNSGYEFDPRRDFQIFWNTFNELYVDFTLSGIDWQTVYSTAEQQLADIETEEELFQLFADMITPLEDGHNELVHGDLSEGVFALLDSDADLQNFAVNHKPDFEDNLLEEFLTTNALTLPLTDAQQEEFENYLVTWEENIGSTIISYADSDIETAADDLFVWFKTDDNIAYLFIEAMAGFGDSEFDIVNDAAVARQVLERILIDIQDTVGLIIDLRLNPGGEDEVSLAIASHFISDTTHAYSKQARLGSDRTELVDVFINPIGDSQYLSPIVLLTSTTTGSAAESFVISMRNLPNVTIAGEPTAGRLSKQLVSRVTSDIAFSLSNEFYFSPAGEWFERIGVPVDHTVPFWTQDLLAQGRDPGIERAIELLSP